ncbi:hypothetical protein [Phaffia rhodozyma]|uniref:Uncharacterized protein n=1 Tax=Phaffia rhodozyma TaxID=264483 RepID=A0A0F7SGY7_PHARH|nr:hypothetical protein [Phaffia rhodozyma]
MKEVGLQKSSNLIRPTPRGPNRSARSFSISSSVSSSVSSSTSSSSSSSSTNSSRSAFTFLRSPPVLNSTPIPIRLRDSPLLLDPTSPFFRRSSMPSSLTKQAETGEETKVRKPMQPIKFQRRFPNLPRPQ